jgi:glutamine synthetase
MPDIRSEARSGGREAVPSSSSSSSSPRRPDAATTKEEEEEEVRRREVEDRTNDPTDGSGCYEAIKLLMQYAGVEFVRYYYVDLVNQPRCKVVPLSHFIKEPHDASSSSNSTPGLTNVAFAAVVMGGLPSYGDVCVPDSGYDASGTVYLKPDLSTLRILPYSPKSAIVTGTLLRQQPYQGGRRGPGSPDVSELCTRSLLQSTLKKLDDTFGVGINVGFELEFCLYDRATQLPVDRTNFASTIPLNRHEDFLSAVTAQLRQQGVVVELLHAESAFGQLELVLQHRSQVVRAIDDVYRAQETIVSVAHQHGLHALFLPKTSPTQAGSGLHVHMSLHRTTTRPTRSANTSSSSSLQTTSEQFVEGMLRHLPSLLALSIPTANSFKRVGPGCWTGSSVSWAVDDKEAPIRVVPRASSIEQGVVVQWEHWEYKLCDATANLHVALAGIVSAGMHGLQSQWALRPPLAREAVPNKSDEVFPASVEQALDFLEGDEYLRDALHPSLVRAYLALRRSEAERAATMTLQDEVDEAFRRAL